MVKSDVTINAKATGGASVKRMQTLMKKAATQYSKINEKSREFNSLARQTSTAMNRTNRSLEMLNQKYTTHKNALRLANQSLNKVVKAENRHAEKIKEANKALDRIVKAEGKFNKKLKDTNKELGKNTKKLDKKKKTSDKVKRSTDKLTKAEEKYRESLLKTNKTSNKKKGGSATNARQSVGVTGLAFGFVGAAAGSMADTVIDHVRRMTEESAELLSDLNRSLLFNSKAWDEFGNIDFGMKNLLKSQRLDLAFDFKIPIEDAIDLTREVDKAIVGVKDAEKYYEAVSKFKHVEPGISGEAIASDLVTIKESSQREVDDIANIMFAYSNASKLGFTQASKAMGFGSDAMRSYNTSLERFAAIMIQATNVAPALAGTAGRAISTLSVDLMQQRDLMEQKYNIKLFDEFADGTQKARDYTEVLVDVIDLINKFKMQGRERDLADFMDELKLEKTARRVLTGLAGQGSDAMRDAIDEIEQSVGTNQLNKFVENQMEQPFEKYIVTLQNRFKTMKMSFGTGFFMGLEKFENVLEKIPWKKFEEMMQGFGEGLADIVLMVEPLIDEFNDLSESMGGARAVGRTLADVVGKVVIGLKALAVIAPLVGVTLGLHYVGTMLSGIRSTGIFIDTLRLAGLRLLRFGLIGLAVAGAFLVLTKTLSQVGTEEDKVNTIFGNFDFRTAEEQIAQAESTSNRLGQLVADVVTYGAIGAAIGSAVPVIGTAIGGAIGVVIASLKNGIDLVKDILLDHRISNVIDIVLAGNSWGTKVQAYWVEVAKQTDIGIEGLKQKFSRVRAEVDKAFSGTNLVDRMAKAWNVDLKPLGTWLGETLGLGFRASWNSTIDAIILHAYNAFTALGVFMDQALSGYKFDPEAIEKAEALGELMLNKAITGDQYESAMFRLNRGDHSLANKLLNDQNVVLGSIGDKMFKIHKLLASGAISLSDWNRAIHGLHKGDTRFADTLLRGAGIGGTHVKWEWERGTSLSDILDRPSGNDLMTPVNSINTNTGIIADNTDPNAEQLAEIERLQVEQLAAKERGDTEQADLLQGMIDSIREGVNSVVTGLSETGNALSNGLVQVAHGQTEQTQSMTQQSIYQMEHMDTGFGIVGTSVGNAATSIGTSVGDVSAAIGVSGVNMSSAIGAADEHIVSALGELGIDISGVGESLIDVINKFKGDKAYIGDVFLDKMGGKTGDKPYLSDKPGSRPPDYDDIISGKKLDDLIGDKKLDHDSSWKEIMESVNTQKILGKLSPEGAKKYLEYLRQKHEGGKQKTVIIDGKKYTYTDDISRVGGLGGLGEVKDIVGSGKDKHGKTLQYYQQKLDEAKERAKGLNANPEYHQPKIDYWQKKVDEFKEVEIPIKLVGDEENEKVLTEEEKRLKAIKDMWSKILNSDIGKPTNLALHEEFKKAKASNSIEVMKQFYDKVMGMSLADRDKGLREKAKIIIDQLRKTHDPLRDELNVIRGFDDEELTNYAKKFMPMYRSITQPYQDAIRKRSDASVKREKSSDALQEFYDKNVGQDAMRWFHGSAQNAPTSIAGLFEEKIRSKEKRIKSRMSQGYRGRTGKLWAAGTSKLKDELALLKNALIEFKSRSDYNEIESQFKELGKIHNVNNKLYTPLFYKAETLGRQIKDKGLSEKYKILADAHNRGLFNIHEFASGGIVKRATMGLVGEKGAEAILPLRELPRLISNSSESKEVNITVNPVINIEGGMNSEMDLDMIAEKIGKQITDDVKRDILDI